MGNDPTKIQFPKQKWTEFQKKGNITIYHNGSGSYAQKKQLTQDKKLQAKEQLQIYKQRCQTKLPIVKVYNVQLVQQKKDFCSTLHKMTVWIQYIPNRLTYIKSFSLSQIESLYVLQQSLKGFHELFKRFGYFEVKSDMIGFNIEGKVKCWINKLYQNNRIQNANDSLLNSSDTPSIKNFDKIDHKLKDSIQKGIVTQIWQIIKKKSNIQNRQLYTRLSNLQSCNFQNALKLIQYLINKSYNQVPSNLLFQNCLQLHNHKYKQFSYDHVYNQENSVTKTVQLYDVQLLQNGILNFNFDITEPNFRDFDLYRQHIQNLNPKKYHKENNKMNISFQKIPPIKDYKKSDNPQCSIKKLPKNVLKLVDKTIDISLSSIPVSPSHKTIQAQTQPTDKKIQSEQNLFLPLQTNIQRTYSSYLVPNAISQRYILNEMPTNQVKLGSPHQIKINHPVQSYNKYPVYVENRELNYENNGVILQNYPSLYRKSTSRYVPPPPIPGIMRRQSSIVGFSNEPNTPQFNKIGYH